MERATKYVKADGTLGIACDGLGLHEIDEELEEFEELHEEEKYKHQEKRYKHSVESLMKRRL